MQIVELNKSQSLISAWKLQNLLLTVTRQDNDKVYVNVADDLGVDLAVMQDILDNLDSLPPPSYVQVCLTDIISSCETIDIPIITEDSFYKALFSQQKDGSVKFNLSLAQSFVDHLDSNTTLTDLSVSGVKNVFVNLGLLIT